MNNLKIAKDQEKIKALRLAEIQATDREDFDACVKDMTKTASLDSSEAEIVANAIRAKYLPNILKESGFADVKPMVNLDEAEETANFANDDDDDTEMEMHHFEDGEEDDTDEMMEDEDEVEDTDTATFEIEVPADMVDAAKKAVQEALDNLMGEDMDSDVDMEDSEMETEDDIEDEDMDTEDEKSEAEMHKTSTKVNNMTKQALAARRAEREEILKKLASEEEKYPASASFKYNDSVELPGEVDYPTLKLQGENSLKEQNPDFADQPVPTNNPGSLNTPSMTKPSKFEGSASGDLEYVVDWDAMDVPSEGEKPEEFEIPTDLPHAHNANRVAAKHNVECTSCGYRMELSDDEMDTADCPKCHGTGKVDEDEADDMEKNAIDTVKLPSNQIRNLQFASVDTARIKTAYSCSSKLAVAGIIDSSEIDSYAEQMLNDDLKADAMIRQTKLLLKSAQSTSERVAAAAAEKMNNVRTASTMGISTSPAFTSSNAANSAALDIQSALRGTWTMPQIED